VDKHDAYRQAKARVEAKFGFFIHLAVYAGVNLLLIMTNLLTAPRYLWFYWPLLGWGIGLFFHALKVFAFTGGLAIKKRMIEKEMAKAARKKQGS
jgi:hypothetical protein